VKNSGYIFSIFLLEEREGRGGGGGGGGGCHMRRDIPCLNTAISRLYLQFYICQCAYCAYNQVQSMRNTVYFHITLCSCNDAVKRVRSCCDVWFTVILTATLQESGEDCMMRRFIVFTAHKMSVR